MYDACIRIEVAADGKFHVYAKDPAIEKQNMEDSDKPYKEPWAEFSFESPKQVAVFVEEVLPKMKPADQTTEFDAAFERALRENED